MEVTMTVTEAEDTAGWESEPVPSSVGVLRPLGEGLWAVDHPDGTRQVWRMETRPGGTSR